MRSRYTAYVLRREDYLLQTWHPETCPVRSNWQMKPVKNGWVWK